MRKQKLQTMTQSTRMSGMSHTVSSGCRRLGASGRSAARFAIATQHFANKIAFSWLVALIGATGCSAGELAVTVVDRLGQGVSEAVVTVAPAVPRAYRQSAATAIMDQRDLAFTPRVLVVAVGTSVEFPNNDTVSHQVYSFSEAKHFQLPLYKGVRHPPITFEHEGLVVLGCNIHDEMVGYIYVTDAPFFGKTDSGGMLNLQELPGGDYRISVWSPIIADPSQTLIHNVHVDQHETTTSRIQLIRELRARPEPRPRRTDWAY